MKELVEENYNYFQWDGILEGLEKGKQEVITEVIKNGFNQGMSSKRIALIVSLSEKEVVLRIKEMKLVRPSRTRKTVITSD